MIRLQNKIHYFELKKKYLFRFIHQKISKFPKIIKVSNYLPKLELIQIIKIIYQIKRY